MITTAEYLTEARGYVNAGWIKHRFEDSQGNVCAMGALHKTFTANRLDAMYHLRDAHLALEEAVTEKHPTDYFTVTIWNDQAERTKEEVLAVFDRAIEIANERKAL